MTKVALTVWDGRISPVFDVCREAQILEIDRGVVLARTGECYDTATTRQKIERMISCGVQILICGAITGPVRDELTARGIEVIDFIAGQVDEVVQAFIDGRIVEPGFAMPGCPGHQRRRRRRRRGATGHRSRPASVATDDHREE